MHAADRALLARCWQAYTTRRDEISRFWAETYVARPLRVDVDPTGRVAPRVARREVG